MAQGKSIGSNVAVVLSADSSGLATGMQKAAQITKTATTQMRGQIMSTLGKLPGGGLLGGMFGAGVGMGVGMLAFNKTIEGIKGVWNWAKETANAFKTEATEANKLAEGLGISSQSLFMLQAAAKGAPFEMLAKVVTKFNLAVMDVNKAGTFAALGLRRMQAQGDETVDTIRNLLAAMEGKTTGEKMGILQRLGLVEGEDVKNIMPLFAQSLAEFDRRVGTARKFGMIPDKEDLERVRQYSHLMRVQEWVGKGIERQVGAKMMGPELWWARTKSSHVLAGFQLFDELVKEKQEWGTWGFLKGRGPDFLLGTPLVYRFGQIRQQLMKEMAGPALQGMATAQIQREEADKLIGPLRQRLDEVMGRTFSVGLDKWAKAQKDAGADRGWIAAQVKATQALQEQVELEVKLQALRKENVPLVVKLRDQMDLLWTERRRTGDKETFGLGLEKLRQQVGALDTPLAQYTMRLRDIAEANGAFVISEQERDRLQSKARGTFLEALGIQRSPVEILKGRLGDIGEAFKAGKITKGERARGIAGLFNQIMGTEARQTPLEGLTAGSVGAAKAILQWQIDSKRQGEGATSRVERLLAEQKQIQERQLQAAEDLARAVEASGLAVIE